MPRQQHRARTARAADDHQPETVRTLADSPPESPAIRTDVPLSDLIEELELALTRAKEAERVEARTAPDPDLKKLSTADLWILLAQAGERIVAGQNAKTAQEQLVHELVKRPRAEAPIERLEAVTGYRRSMIYKLGQRAPEKV